MISILLNFLLMNITSAARLRTSNDPVNCSKTITLKNGEIPSYVDEQWDSYCAHKFISRVAPHGTLSVFGAYIVSEQHQDEYELIRTFAKKWTEQPRAQLWPIATGGGLGIMEAATRGAREARGGKGIALSFLIPVDKNGQFEKNSPFNLKEYSFTYRDIAKREADLINYAEAIVVGLGGVGTQGELMFTLSELSLHKKKPIPLIVLAPKDEAEKFISGFFTLIQMGLLDKKTCELLNLTNSAEKAVELILMKENQRKQDDSSACNFFTNNLH